MNRKLSHITQVILGTLVLLFVGEIISFWTWQTPDARPIIFTAFLFMVFVAGLKNPRIPIYALFAELIVGGKGYLLYTNIAEQTLSLRLGLFLVAFLIFVLSWLRSQDKKVLPQKLRYPYAAFVIVILSGALNGHLHHYAPNDIFLDMNGYLFLGALLPLFFSIKTQKHFHTFFAVMIAAFIALTIKSYIILFIFSHKIISWMSVVYPWVRKTGVGEITLLWGDFYRVFIQSHFLIVAMIFVALALTITWFYRQQPKTFLNDRIFWLLFGSLAVTLSMDILSYSRSFWLASAVTAVAFAMHALRKKYTVNAFIKTVALSLMSLTVALGLLLSIINIPIGGLRGAGVGAVSLIDERTDVIGEQAAGSRFNLWGPLTAKVYEHPVIGSGFATTVTYETLDWRALENNPDGQFTTYSFEWGYLDILTEVGLLGLLVYLWFAYTIVRQLCARLKQSSTPATYANEGLFTGLLFALLFLYTTHAFTPYLNHPIGLGLIAVAALVAFQYDTA